MRTFVLREGNDKPIVLGCSAQTCSTLISLWTYIQTPCLRRPDKVLFLYKLQPFTIKIEDEISGISQDSQIPTTIGLRSLHKSDMYKILFSKEFTFISINVSKKVCVNRLFAFWRRLRRVFFGSLGD